MIRDVIYDLTHVVVMFFTDNGSMVQEQLCSEWSRLHINHLFKSFDLKIEGTINSIHYRKLCNAVVPESHYCCHTKVSHWFCVVIVICLIVVNDCKV